MAQIYRIVKDISSTCGSSDHYAIKSGWYIVEDCCDGLNTVKISRYNAGNNKWSDDIKIDYGILVINGEVESPKKFVEEYEPQVLKEWENKLYKHLEDIHGDNLNNFDAIQAIDFFIDQWGWDIFANVLKKYKVAYKYYEGDDPKDILNNDTQLEYYKALEDWWR